ncbi:MAG: hypothetical protein K5839_00660, partial [Treponemataceae bacterium]|nr:hypothetical protein [Treponemataceae bacterium]
MFLFIFNTIHILPKYHAVDNSFFSALIKAISFSWHFENAVKGIIDTRDLFYYLILTFTFLYLSFNIYKKKKGLKFFNYRNCIILVILLLSLIDTNLF